jgi:hypothetical protein
VRPALAGGTALALLLVCGCTPQPMHWEGTTPTIGPQAPVAAASPQPKGYLVIQLPPTIGQPGDDEPQHYPPVYVYDRHGQYVQQLWNDTEYPTPLTPGDYIVLVGETDPMGEFHQLQVHVDDGRTTAVSLADIDRAPRFWELLQQFKN